jgi:PAS domain S-box-containing protein
MSDVDLSDADLAGIVFENVRSHGVIAMRPDGTIVAWSLGAESIIGRNRGSALGANFSEIFVEVDRAAGVPQAELQTAIEAGRAEDSRWHVKADGSFFWSNGATVHVPARDLLIKIFRDETAAQKAEEQRLLLLHELNHRVKNTLATVQSVAEQTLRIAGVDPEVRTNLTERIIALSRTHDVLVDSNWAGAELRALLREVFAPYPQSQDRIHTAGPLVYLHPSQAVSIAMACHELATNAVKYGALQGLAGRVRVSWNLAHNGPGERFLTLVWREEGGPPVSPPVRTGFGSKMIRQTFAGGGRAEVTYPPEGVQAVLVLQLRDDDAASICNVDVREATES